MMKEHRIFEFTFQAYMALSLIFIISFGISALDPNLTELAAEGLVGFTIANALVFSSVTE